MRNGMKDIWREKAEIAKPVAVQLCVVDPGVRKPQGEFLLILFPLSLYLLPCCLSRVPVGLEGIHLALNAAFKTGQSVMRFAEFVGWVHAHAAVATRNGGTLLDVGPTTPH